MKLPYSISANTFNYLFLVVSSMILSRENRTHGKEVRLDWTSDKIRAQVKYRMHRKKICFDDR